MTKTVVLTIKKNRSLSEQLRDRGYYSPAWCGGRGLCGKCRVRFCGKAPKAGRQDEAFFTEQELKEGFRLACSVYAEGTYEILMEDLQEEKIEAADLFYGSGEASDTACRALAIDIGTTTIAASLLDTKKKHVIKTVTGINHQRVFGADVLSRIDAANRGEGKKLQEMVLSDMSSLCRELGAGSQVTGLDIPVVISGNTTMEHLLQGLSCESLGVYPFTPVDISLHTFKNMTILPCISTFLGADIVSGMIACDMDRKDEISILVDLGTNGEMLIGNRHKILAASAAAGPAFEGGNITHGMAGIPGAIDTVLMKEDHVRVTTIGGETPAGICGSGVIETLYELKKEKMIDETGLLGKAYFDKGYPLAPDIIFTQRDIRMVQMAKSAIRAGIEILLDAYGVNYDRIDRLYLAGGFGQKINCAKAVGIGMLPEELAGRITPIGNSSLEGAVLYAMNQAPAERFTKAAEISEEISLSEHDLFNDLYMKYMFL